MTRETRSYKRVPAPELRAAADGQTATLTGYAAVFGSYSQNLGGFVEVIARDAFANVLGNDVVGLVNHDPNMLLATTESSTLTLATDDTGLRYEMTLDLTDPTAVSAAAKIRSGKMPGSSFSFRTSPDGDTWSQTDQGFPLRTLTNIEVLYDVGPVTMPAYLGTKGEGVAAAVRSLAASTSTAVDVLVAAAGRNELRSFLPSMAEENEGGQASNATGLHAHRARQLALMASRFSW